MIPTFQVQGFGGFLVLILLWMILILSLAVCIFQFFLSERHTMVWYHYWYQFFFHRDTTFGDPLKNYPGRLQFSPPFHQADQAVQEDQISLLSVAERRSGALEDSW